MLLKTVFTNKVLGLQAQVCGNAVRLFDMDVEAEGLPPLETVYASPSAALAAARATTTYGDSGPFINEEERRERECG
jgi:hypothetical protein